MIKVYGLKNCDTCRKVVKWLQAQGADFDFTDFRKDGLPPARLEAWLEAVGWQRLLNKRGTTWRGLDPAIQDRTNAANVAELLLAHPALIKRPVIEVGQQVLVGFKQTEQEALANHLASIR